MPIYAVGDKVPKVHPTAFIAPTATIVGDVTIHERASVWYGAVVRGDTSYAIVGPGANVQDGAVVHGRAGLPALIGADKAFWISRLFHAGTVGSLAMVGTALGLGLGYFAGIGLIGALLVYEHSLLHPRDLSNMQKAFFQMNALVSLTFLASVLWEVAR